MTKTERLRQELTKQLDYFDKESIKHKTLYRRLRYSALSLTAAGTVLAAAAVTAAAAQAWLNLAVVAATAIAGVLSSIEGLRKPAELWIHERNVYYALKDLLREVEFESAEADSLEKKADGYFDRFQAILSTAKEKWLRELARAGRTPTAAIKGQITTPPTGQTTPPADESSATPADDSAPTPPGDKGAPPADESSASPADESAPTPPGDNGATPADGSP